VHDVSAAVLDCISDVDDCCFIELQALPVQVKQDQNLYAASSRLVLRACCSDLRLGPRIATCQFTLLRWLAALAGETWQRQVLCALDNVLTLLPPTGQSGLLCTCRLALGLF
jgi:hypothetical protein